MFNFIYIFRHFMWWVSGFAAAIFVPLCIGTWLTYGSDRDSGIGVLIFFVGAIAAYRPWCMYDVWVNRFHPGHEYLRQRHAQNNTDEI